MDFARVAELDSLRPSTTPRWDLKLFSSYSFLLLLLLFVVVESLDTKGYRSELKQKKNQLDRFRRRLPHTDGAVEFHVRLD